MSSAPTPIEVLLTGATGYIGGTVLHLLLARQDQSHPRFHFTALVRSKDSAAKLATLSNGHHRVTPLLGSLDDWGLLADAAGKSDLALHFADSDHMPAVDAITTGLIRRRKDGSGRKRAILIHTSGCGEIMTSRDKGELGQQAVLSDLDMDAIHSIPITQIHRDVDSLIFERLGGSGDDAAYDSIIVAPPPVWGRGLGLFNRSSIQIPSIIRGFVAHRQAFSAGRGLNQWDHVHVEDLARLYVLLVDQALAGTADTGREGGWYFAENGHFTEIEIIDRVAELLYKRGAIASPQVIPFKDDAQAQNVLGLFWSIFGNTSKSRADRSRRLGWVPKYSTADMLTDIEEEVHILLHEKKA
jgi:nucleoside-diphosphate-sugar epimerase